MNIQAAIIEFTAQLTEQAVNRYGSTSLDADVYTVDPRGRKFARIVCNNHGRGDSRYVHCFVEKATGLIWKAAGWNGPATNYPRGSVLDLPSPLPRCW